MSYDALMRWEWEGGTPVPISERSEGFGADKAQHAPAVKASAAAEVRQPVAPALRPRG